MAFYTAIIRDFLGRDLFTDIVMVCRRMLLMMEMLRLGRNDIASLRCLGRSFMRL